MIALAVAISSGCASTPEPAPEYPALESVSPSATKSDQLPSDAGTGAPVPAPDGGTSAAPAN